MTALTQQELVDGDEVPRVAAAMGLLLAGGIHLAVVPEHWSVSVPITVFFVTVGLGQLLLAALAARRWWTWFTGLVVAGHMAVIALYVASRTVDLPFVPPHDAGHTVDHLPVAGGIGEGIPVYPGSRIEPVGPLDLVCLAAELLVVGALLGLVDERWRRVLTAFAVGLALTGLAARLGGLLL